jgi:HEAT repeat protein
MKRVVLACCLGSWLACATSPAWAAQQAQEQRLSTTVEAALKQLESKDPAVRRDGAFALATVGSPDALLPAMRPLIAALRYDSDERVRELAAFALGNLGPAGAPAVEWLIVALRDNGPGVRALAAQALGSSLHSVADKAIGPLIEQFKDPEVAPRMQAARALETFGARAKVAVPALIRLLKDPAPTVRLCAATSLGGIGPDAREAVPALQAALQDENAIVRERAAGALEKIGAAPGR